VTDNSRDASQEAKGIDRCCMVLLFSPPLVQIDQTLFCFLICIYFCPWKKPLNISPRHYSPIMYGTRGMVEDTYTHIAYAETFLACICSLWLAELTEVVFL
jgi:hypothetical protein